MPLFKLRRKYQLKAKCFNCYKHFMLSIPIGTDAFGYIHGEIGTCEHCGSTNIGIFEEADERSKTCPSCKGRCKEENGRSPNGRVYKFYRCDMCGEEFVFMNEMKYVVNVMREEK